MAPKLSFRFVGEIGLLHPVHGASWVGSCHISQRIPEISSANAETFLLEHRVQR
ncbi:hypothetical protein FA13DRAFT_1726539 [Coprinellus micaceus]|uniref:Uncharacterized protein n=1 Tax=Coprinellus micaceus TaxID=71717 RepID=A0A4Y7TTY8_COPMI|nr:hypothetical protein FA13DRAFT_1726539 [Coprinellus micaceus]